MNIVNAYLSLRIGMIEHKLAKLGSNYSFQNFLLEHGDYNSKVADKEIELEEKMNALRGKKSKLMGKIKE